MPLRHILSFNLNKSSINYLYIYLCCSLYDAAFKCNCHWAYALVNLDACKNILSNCRVDVPKNYIMHLFCLLFKLHQTCLVFFLLNFGTFRTSLYPILISLMICYSIFICNDCHNTISLLKSAFFTSLIGRKLASF